MSPTSFADSGDPLDPWDLSGSEADEYAGWPARDSVERAGDAVLGDPESAGLDGGLEPGEGGRADGKSPDDEALCGYPLCGYPLDDDPLDDDPLPDRLPADEVADAPFAVRRLSTAQLVEAVRAARVAAGIGEPRDVAAVGAGRSGEAGAASAVGAGRSGEAGAAAAVGAGTRGPAPIPPDRGQPSRGRPDVSGQPGAQVDQPVTDRQAGQRDGRGTGDAAVRDREAEHPGPWVPVHDGPVSLEGVSAPPRRSARGGSCADRRDVRRGRDRDEGRSRAGGARGRRGAAVLPKGLRDAVVAAPPRVVIMGACGGSGASTVALLLAAALAPAPGVLLIGSGSDADVLGQRCSAAGGDTAALDEWLVAEPGRSLDPGTPGMADGELGTGPVVLAGPTFGALGSGGAGGTVGVRGAGGTVGVRGAGGTVGVRGAGGTVGVRGAGGAVGAGRAGAIGGFGLGPGAAAAVYAAAAGARGAVLLDHGRAPSPDEPSPVLPGTRVLVTVPAGEAGWARATGGFPGVVACCSSAGASVTVVVVALQPGRPGGGPAWAQLRALGVDVRQVPHDRALGRPGAQRWSRWRPGTRAAAVALVAGIVPGPSAGSLPGQRGLPAAVPGSGEWR